MNNKRLVSIAVITIVILVAISINLSITLKKSKVSQVDENTSNIVNKIPEESEAQIISEEVAEIEKDYNSWTAELKDVSGGRSTGMGYILRDGEVLAHKVMAELPDIEGDNFYEGWLVKQTPKLEFFSTGELTQGENGDYSLDFQTDTVYEDFNFVVITLETERDDVPEKHILEGLAE